MVLGGQAWRVTVVEISADGASGRESRAKRYEVSACPQASNG